MAPTGHRPTPHAQSFLALYVAALIVVWLVTVATWTVARGQPLELHPAAAGLQYLLVVLAATLAALQLRLGPADDHPSASFGWFDYRWSIPDDVGGRSFWRAMGIGALAMEVNVALLIVADVIAASAAGSGSYLEWLGSGIAAGGVLGIVGALLAAVGGAVIRRRARS